MNNDLSCIKELDTCLNEMRAKGSHGNEIIDMIVPRFLNDFQNVEDIGHIRPQTEEIRSQTFSGFVVRFLLFLSNLKNETMNGTKPSEQYGFQSPVPRLFLTGRDNTTSSSPHPLPVKTTSSSSRKKELTISLQSYRLISCMLFTARSLHRLTTPPPAEASAFSSHRFLVMSLFQLAKTIDKHLSHKSFLRNLLSDLALIYEVDKKALGDFLQQLLVLPTRILESDSASKSLVASLPVQLNRSGPLPTSTILIPSLPKVFETPELFFSKLSSVVLKAFLEDHSTSSFRGVSANVEEASGTTKSDPRGTKGLPNRLPVILNLFYRIAVNHGRPNIIARTWLIELCSNNGFGLSDNTTIAATGVIYRALCFMSNVDDLNFDNGSESSLSNQVNIKSRSASAIIIAILNELRHSLNTLKQSPAIPDRKLEDQYKLEGIFLESIFQLKRKKTAQRQNLLPGFQFAKLTTSWPSISVLTKFLIDNIIFRIHFDSWSVVLRFLQNQRKISTWYSLIIHLTAELTSQWSKASFVRNSSGLKHEITSRSILFLLGLLEKDDIENGKGMILTNVLSGVQVHMEIALTARRRRGLAIAERFSNILDPKNPLKFEELNGLREEDIKSKNKVRQLSPSSYDVTDIQSDTSALSSSFRGQIQATVVSAPGGNFTTDSDDDSVDSDMEDDLIPFDYTLGTSGTSSTTSRTFGNTEISGSDKTFNSSHASPKGSHPTLPYLSQCVTRLRALHSLISVSRTGGAGAGVQLSSATLPISMQVNGNLKPIGGTQGSVSGGSRETDADAASRTRFEGREAIKNVSGLVRERRRVWDRHHPNAADDLTKGTPPQLQAYAIPLSALMISVQGSDMCLPAREIVDFETERHRALVALCVTTPTLVVPYLLGGTDSGGDGQTSYGLFSPHLNLADRLQILSIVVDAALELSTRRTYIEREDQKRKDQIRQERRRLERMDRQRKRQIIASVTTVEGKGDDGNEGDGGAQLPLAKEDKDGNGTYDHKNIEHEKRNNNDGSRKGTRQDNVLSRIEALSISNRKTAGRTIKRFTRPQKATFHKNRFAPIAHLFFLPLALNLTIDTTSSSPSKINNDKRSVLSSISFSGKEMLSANKNFGGCVDLMGRDHVLLTRMVLGCGVFIECCGLHPVAWTLGRLALEVLLRIRFHSHVSVRRAVLFVLSRVILLDITGGNRNGLLKEKLEVGGIWHEWTETLVLMSEREVDKQCKDQAGVLANVFLKY
eukprot:g1715.t1